MDETNKYREALNHIVNCDRDDGGVSNLSDAYRNDISDLMELISLYESGKISTYEEIVKEHNDYWSRYR